MQDWNTKINRERALIFKALGHPLRLAIMDELKTKECCVQDLEAKLGAEQSNISRHLAVLKQAGVIDFRKEGLYAYYFLAFPCISGFFSCVNQVLVNKFNDGQQAIDYHD